MIISVEELMALPEFANQDANIMKQKLDSLELLIRKYTNNNFQNRNIRFTASVIEGNYLNNVSPYIRVGDTVQISESEVNDGLYVVDMVKEDRIRVKEDHHLFLTDHNLVTKVEYPADIKMGIINMMKWEIGNRNKVGIKQETLSRHSVTYFDQDANNQVMGFPVSLLGFLEPYKKARF